LPLIWHSRLPDAHSAERPLHDPVLWLLGLWTEPVVSLPDVYQLGRAGVRDNATAKKIVRILEDHGWLRPVPGGGHVAGVKRREVWQIVRG
jgi:hypothetical protein